VQGAEKKQNEQGSLSRSHHRHHGAIEKKEWMCGMVETFSVDFEFCDVDLIWSTILSFYRVWSFYGGTLISDDKSCRKMESHLCTRV
jgi:hypothetical protein